MEDNILGNFKIGEESPNEEIVNELIDVKNFRKLGACEITIKNGRSALTGNLKKDDCNVVSDLISIKRINANECRPDDEICDL